LYKVCEGGEWRGLNAKARINLDEAFLPRSWPGDHALASCSPTRGTTSLPGSPPPFATRGGRGGSNAWGQATARHPGRQCSSKQERACLVPRVWGDDLSYHQNETERTSRVESSRPFFQKVFLGEVGVGPNGTMPFLCGVQATKSFHCWCSRCVSVCCCFLFSAAVPPGWCLLHGLSPVSFYLLVLLLTCCAACSRCSL
jgi:hypothetical protein